MNGIVKRIVLALGGNALGQTPQEQIQLVKKTAKSIVDLVEEGYEIVVGHGNGPQIVSNACKAYWHVLYQTRS